MRTLAELSGYVATTDAEGVQLQQYVSGRLTARVAAGEVQLTTDTDYPWDGRIQVRVEKAPEGEWTLSMRIPGWAEGATLRVGDEERSVEAGSNASIRRAWSAGDTVELTLPMDVRLVEADERIDDVRGCVAIERGPLVFAVEQVDQGDGVVVDDLRLDPGGTTATEHRRDLLSGVTVVTARGRATRHVAEGPALPAGRRDTPGGGHGRRDHGGALLRLGEPRSRTDAGVAAPGSDPSPDLPSTPSRGRHGHGSTDVPPALRSRGARRPLRLRFGHPARARRDGGSFR